MNNKIIEDLVEMGIYNSKTLTEESFKNLSNNNSNDSLLYISGNYGNNNESSNYYKEINTNNLTIEEIKLQLDINRTKYIKSIKNMITFFTVITVIGIISVVFLYLS